MSSTEAEPVGLPSLWAGRLHSAGLRSTIQRLMILGELQKTHHATAQQIHDRLAATAAAPDVSTIYRNLETLTEHGFVSHVHLGGLTPSYLLADRATHGHLVCRNCGAVTELNPIVTKALAHQLGADYAFDVDVSHLSLFGLCSECTSSTSGQLGR